MYLSSLRYKLSDAQNAKNARFQTGSGRLRTLYLYYGSDQESFEILNALYFCLGEQSQVNFEYVILEVSDDSGVKWSLLKTPIRFEFYKNGQLLPAHEIKDSVLATMLDLDLPTESNDEPRSFETRMLRRMQQKTYLKKCDQQAFLSVQGNELINKTEVLYNEILGITQNEKISSPGDINKFYMTLMPLVERLKALRSTANLMKQEEKTIDAGVSANKLFQELNVIAQVDHITKDLEQHIETARLQRQQIQQTEAEFNLQVGQFEPLHKLLPWKSIIDTLAQKVIYDQLAQDFDKVIHNHLEPAERQHQELCGQMSGVHKDIKKLELQIDKSIADLNAKIQQRQVFLNEQKQRRQEIQEKEPSEVLLKWIQKRLPFKGQKDGTKVDEQVQKTDSALHELEQMKTAFAKAAKLADSLTNFVSQDVQRPQTLVKKFYQKYEQLTHEHTRSKAQWTELIEDYGLPEDLSLDDVAAYLNQFSQHQQLSHLKSQLDTTLAQIKQRQVQLHKQVQLWRDATHSVRQQKIENMTSLLAEAKGISRFRFERENLLSKYNENQAREMLPSVVRGHIDRQISQTSGEISQCLERYGCRIENAGEMSDNLEQLIAKLAHFNALSSYFDSELWFQDWQELKTYETSTPLVFLIWNQNHLGMQETEKVCASLQQLRFQGCTLILCNDIRAQTMLAKFGVGRVQLVISESQRSGAASPQKSAGIATKTIQDSSKKIISPRAEEALKVLRPQIAKEGVKR